MNHGPIGLQPIALPLSYTPWLRKLPRQLQTVVQLTNWIGPSKCTADKAACNCKGHRKCCYFLQKHFVYQNLLYEESKKRLLRLREKNAFPNGNVACNLILWSCSKAFFLFLWRRQFQLDWTLFGRFDSTHFYGRDSSLSLIRTHAYYLLFYISAILSWLPCRHSIRPTTKNRLDRRVDTFFSVQLHMEDRWLLKKITWH